MKNPFQTIWLGAKETLTHRNYLILFFSSFVLMFVLFTFIPVWTVAGNTLSTQLTIFTTQDYVTITLLSGLYALFIAMQVYAMRKKKSVEGVGTQELLFVLHALHRCLPFLVLVLEVLFLLLNIVITLL
jgi:hypothetical protein